jgi:hypothetical protein
MPHRDWGKWQVAHYGWPGEIRHRSIDDATPVYNPGGPVCIVDDFAVAPAEECRAVGGPIVASFARHNGLVWLWTGLGW